MIIPKESPSHLLHTYRRPTRMMKTQPFLYLLLSCCFLQNTDCKKPDCSAVLCLACPENHLAVTPENECCPRCIPQCFCPRRLRKFCPKGYLLKGESVVTDYANQKCTCIEVNVIKCI